MSHVLRVNRTLKTGLIAWWDFENNGNDSHAGRNLTNVGTPSYVAGKVGQGSSHNAANNWYVTDTVLNTGNVDWTWCQWVYFTAKATYYHAGISDASGALREWSINVQGSVNRFNYVIIHSLGAGQVFFNTPISAATWYFVRAWYVASEKKGYIDINESGAPAATGVMDGELVATSSPLGIGSLGLQTAVRLNGQTDSCAFWKRLLTSAEGAWLYNSGSGRAYTELT